MATTTAPPDPDQVRAQVMAQAAARQRITDSAVAAARALTQDMTDAQWHTSAAITTYAAAMVVVIETWQRQMAAVTNAYQARVLTTLTGRSAAPGRQVAVNLLRGIPHRSVYGRMADYYRFLLSGQPASTPTPTITPAPSLEGAAATVSDTKLSRAVTTPTPEMPRVAHPPEVAQQLVVERAAQVAEMDVLLANRAQNREVLKGKARVRGYRRVIHPELSKSGASCGLCIVASARVYHKAELMPIHFRCNCDVVAIVDGVEDVGHQINLDDLHDLYAAAGGNQAKKLKETRFTVRQHGELGPVLVYRGKGFRGPADVREDTDPDSGKPVPLE